MPQNVSSLTEMLMYMEVRKITSINRPLNGCTKGGDMKEKDLLFGSK